MNDVAELEFDPFNMETSSQIGGMEHLDQTSDICAEYLKGTSEQKEYDDNDLDNTVENIVATRTKNTETQENIIENLIQLNETISADQDHNYLSLQ